jgi:hypothetical protein
VGDFNDCMPFQRGATYGAADETVATHLEGREYEHQDQEYGTNRTVRVRVVRNRSGATLSGKRAVSYASTAGKVEIEVSGYARIGSAKAHIVDDFLNANGVPDKDLFYVVVEGPCLAKTPLEGDALNVFAVGDLLHALTAATTGATTAGRLVAATLTGATSVLANQIANVVGRALSAKTTANTNADILIHAGRF